VELRSGGALGCDFANRRLQKSVRAAPGATTCGPAGLNRNRCNFELINHRDDRFDAAGSPLNRSFALAGPDRPVKGDNAIARENADFSRVTSRAGSNLE